MHSPQERTKSPPAAPDGVHISSGHWSNLDAGFSAWNPFGHLTVLCYTWHSSDTIHDAAAGEREPALRCSGDPRAHMMCLKMGFAGGGDRQLHSTHHLLHQFPIRVPRGSHGSTKPWSGGTRRALPLCLLPQSRSRTPALVRICSLFMQGKTDTRTRFSCQLTWGDDFILLCSLLPHAHTVNIIFKVWWHFQEDTTHSNLNNELFSLWKVVTPPRYLKTLFHPLRQRASRILAFLLEFSPNNYV